MNRDREIRRALGVVIRDTRKARGLTLKSLASLSDIDWSQLSKVERGDSGVSAATMERIGRELGFTLPALYSSAFARISPIAARVVRGVARATPRKASNRSA